MTPFIYFDNEMVTSKTWPDEKLKIAGETIDPATVGKIYEYRKMPLLSVQFRDNAVFQADKPVTIWGSTRQYGEWQSGPEEGDCKVHFEFGDIKKTIDVTPEMAEWKVTLPPMKAGPKPHTLKVNFTIDGEMVHERVVTGIVFGDVWYVAAPVGKFKVPEVKPSGQIVRMIENQSNRDGRDDPSRFSICTSRTPRVMEANGKWSNRLAAYWKDAEGLAAALGNSISAKTGRPVGIIFLQAKKDIPLKNWIAPSFLKDAPSLMEDYKTVGSQYFDNPYYLANVRRYIAEWKTYWGEYIPAMMETKAVPDGSSWGQLSLAETGSRRFHGDLRIQRVCALLHAGGPQRHSVPHRRVDGGGRPGRQLRPGDVRAGQLLQDPVHPLAGRRGYSLHLHRSEQDAGTQAHAAGRHQGQEHRGGAWRLVGARRGD